MLVRCAVQEFCTGAVPGLGPWAARPLRLAPSGSLRPRPQPRESALWLVFTGYRRGSPAPPLRVAGCGTRGRLWPTSRADALLRGGSARRVVGTIHGRRRFAVRPAATGSRLRGLSHGRGRFAARPAAGGSRLPGREQPHGRRRFAVRPDAARFRLVGHIHGRRRFAVRPAVSGFGSWGHGRFAALSPCCEWVPLAGSWAIPRELAVRPGASWFCSPGFGAWRVGLLLSYTRII